ncbi:MAG: peptide chain release factor 2 [Deltaproteobacteria bacterium]|nr:peptide chain release factor 2 [Deltaproteobacteria bacterium]
MSRELSDLYTRLTDQLAALRRHLDVAGKQARIQSLEIETHQADFWNNAERARRVGKELTQLQAEVRRFATQERVLADVRAILDLLRDDDDPDLAAEAGRHLDGVQAELAAMEFERMLSGPHDFNSAILSINAGAGGTEACDWSEILLRMYRRWAEARGMATQVVDFTAGEGAGFRSVTMTVEGPYAYGHLRAEIGVHRLVRISPFDANKRRHTSFASVFVLPDIEDEVVIDVKEADLRVDTFRSGGAGGQKVNKTDSAVRLTHLPTGIVVACQNERSQHKNRAMAMKLLKAKLYEAEMEKKRRERAAVEATKADIAWGSQIRSYVLQPYQLVKDHRTGYEVGNVQAILDGGLDELIRRYLLHSAGA